ncbi:transcription/translation regulatory transformer protein RfaH [Pseudidiomarina sediminum]|uniref:Transcription/translation regulatory transformer protein RfaH n=1 Tax=Pseudidiomarina sediminum TaxID=431675 RepID=A0A432Z9C9_9GAMM|nr:transcription/translation regulatory transformer protein RfaH [Pseudidiomarina sediminum]RUO74536.1 transcription/translation regulatory transformer protein RfaH [Pseudidiomarina sediminum]
MVDTSSAWYVIQTKPKQEQRARTHLENLAFDVALPMLSIERVRRGKRTAVSEPLFPSYIFVKVDAASPNFHRIRSTLGVSKLVKFGETPAQVSDDVVSQMLCFSEKNETAQQLDPNAAPQVGDQVEIVEGPFSGLLAKVVALDGASRCVVLLDFLQKQVRAEFALSSLKR